MQASVALHATDALHCNRPSGDDKAARERLLKEHEVRLSVLEAYGGLRSAPQTAPKVEDAPLSQRPGTGLSAEVRDTLFDLHRSRWKGPSALSEDSAPSASLAHLHNPERHPSSLEARRGLR